MFDQLQNIDKKYYCSDYYDVSVNKYGAKWEIKTGLMKKIPMTGFIGILLIR